MYDFVDRRRFLLAAGATLAAPLLLPANRKAFAASPDGGIKKAVKFNMVTGKVPVLDKFKMLKEIGFDGVELESPNKLELSEVLEARDKTGLTIHGVVDSVHWSHPLSDPDPQVREYGLEGLKTALRDAKAYGASTVLLVPANVTKETNYADAYRLSQAEIRKVLPMAEELGVRILFENVWNSFLLSPLEFATYIDEFESPIVGAYFDVGNVVIFGWPEQWIRILGKRIGKIDVKEFSRKMAIEKGQRSGFGAEIGEGDCDWPAVMQALQEVGYTGWGTAEVRGGGRERMEEIYARMDHVLKTNG